MCIPTQMRCTTSVFFALIIMLLGTALDVRAQSSGRAAAPAKTAPAAAAPAPEAVGVWVDDTGQGAIEVLPCGERLCGRIVWLKDPTDKGGGALTDALNPNPANRQRPICGLQVIGNLELQSNGSWDKGWIYDPKEGKSYDVELTLRGADRLQVRGYLGVKFLSETFVWARAPADLPKCSTPS